MSEFFKAYNSVYSYTVDKAHNGGKHLDQQFLNEEGAMLCVDKDEFRLYVFHCDVPQVHVDDLASLEVLVVEVAKHELTASDIRQEFLFLDLSVGTMPLDFVLLLHLELVLGLGEPLLSDFSHYLFLLFIIVVFLV